jgi:hypothetical protein
LQKKARATLKYRAIRLRPRFEYTKDFQLGKAAIGKHPDRKRTLFCKRRKYSGKTTKKHTGEILQAKEKSKKIRSAKPKSATVAIIYEPSCFRFRHSTLQNVKRAALNQGDTSNRAHLFSTCFLCESATPYGLRDTDKAIHFFSSPILCCFPVAEKITHYNTKNFC